MVESALQLYALRHGRFPASVEALTESGLLRPRVQTTIARLAYTTNGTKYTLAWAP